MHYFYKNISIFYILFQLMFILFNNPVSQKHAQIKFHPQNLKEGKNY